MHCKQIDEKSLKAHVLENKLQNNLSGFFSCADELQKYVTGRMCAVRMHLILQAFAFTAWGILETTTETRLAATIVYPFTINLLPSNTFFTLMFAIMPCQTIIFRDKKNALMIITP